MLMTLLIGVLAFVIIAALGLLLTEQGTASPALAKRTQSISMRATTRKARNVKVAKTADDRRKQILEQMQEAERRERKLRMSLKTRMLYAGLEPKIVPFWIGSIVLGTIVFFIPLVLLGNMPVLIRIGIAFLAAFALGYGFPRWVLGFMAAGRSKKFTSEFPTAIDILVRGIKSGLPVHDGLKVIAKECSAPLGPEFQRMVENVGVGMGLDKALEKMIERMPSPELKFFAIVLAIQQKTGGNLAEALGNLSSVLRARKMMREKIKAMSSEAIASAGIIGSLPPGVGLMIFMTRPAYIMVMFTDVRGQLMLLAGIVWMGLGIMAMRKMINFKL
jgi:tight adherence protein B